MRIGLLTREYSPEVYGGAGVHVDHLVPELRRIVDVDVHCFGGPRPDARSHGSGRRMENANAALRTLAVDLSMADAVSSVDLVHSHTWYTNFAGHLAKVLHGVPHVVTAHSLEPRRPWKAEQLGGGYRLSSWVERTAYESADAIIAVSDGMRTDVLDCYPALDPARVHVVRNGIDTTAFRPVEDRSLVRARGIDPTRPMVVFVGRITRQKGVGHLIAAAHDIGRDAQIVLCAGAPDTPELAAETEAAVAELAAARPGVFWIREMLSTDEIRQMLSAASVFVCPSVYEPLGIVNLEAMACGTAVVASDVGGIPEVVTDGRTGLLAHYDERDTRSFERDLADAVNKLLADPGLAADMGAAGRVRAASVFPWRAVAEQTMRVYRSALGFA
jgi:alpha-maltose-1-phosphate synthase